MAQSPINSHQLSFEGMKRNWERKGKRERVCVSAISSHSHQKRIELLRQEAHSSTNQHFFWLWVAKEIDWFDGRWAVTLAAINILQSISQREWRDSLFCWGLKSCWGHFVYSNIQTPIDFTHKFTHQLLFKYFNSLKLLLYSCHYVFVHAAAKVNSQSEERKRAGERRVERESRSRRTPER